MKSKWWVIESDCDMDVLELKIMAPGEIRTHYQSFVKKTALSN